MKILYGVQGTGNGHISRANAMADAFRAYPDVEVTWLLSGRKKSQGCGGIEKFLWREGMTFAAKNGKVDLLGTLRKNNLVQFYKDINSLELTPYDLVISDYEPVISHAARKRGIPVTGIGHQYAFNYDIPKHGANIITNNIMEKFAPADIAVGLHWHHFNSPILPPILDIEIPAVLPELIQNKVLIYLPFEEPKKIKEIIEHNKDFEFYIYHPSAHNEDVQNLHWRAISRNGFKRDLLNCKSVITNSGFELISECLKLGKSILTKPMRGQMEQMSNASALKVLDYAQVINELENNKIKKWLHQDNKITKVDYPDVANCLASWIANGCIEDIQELSTSLWGETSFNNMTKKDKAAA